MSFLICIIHVIRVVPTSNYRKICFLAHPENVHAEEETAAPQAPPFPSHSLGLWDAPWDKKRDVPGCEGLLVGTGQPGSPSPCNQSLNQHRSSAMETCAPVLPASCPSLCMWTGQTPHLEFSPTAPHLLQNQPSSSLMSQSPYIYQEVMLPCPSRWLYCLSQADSGSLSTRTRILAPFMSHCTWHRAKHIRPVNEWMDGWVSEQMYCGSHISSFLLLPPPLRRLWYVCRCHSNIFISSSMLSGINFFPFLLTQKSDYSRA